MTNFGTFTSLSILVEVPDNWTWTYEQNVITCSNLKKLPDKTFLLKAVEILNRQELLYHMNGKILKSLDLPKQFNSIEDLSLIIRDFARRNFCTGFHREDVNVVVKTEKLSSHICYDEERYRSKNCWYWSSKQNLCRPCLSLRNYISKRLRKPSKKMEMLNKKSREPISRRGLQSILDNSRRKVKNLKSENLVMVFCIREKFSS